MFSTLKGEKKSLASKQQQVSTLDKFEFTNTGLPYYQTLCPNCVSVRYRIALLLNLFYATPLGAVQVKDG